MASAKNAHPKDAYPPVIAIQRAYETAAPTDGYRILVDHFWPRGRSKTDLVNLKHAISRVRSGERVGVELLFHDAIHGLIGVV
jgi:hypothetical protein